MARIISGVLPPLNLSPAGGGGAGDLRSPQHTPGSHGSEGKQVCKYPPPIPFFFFFGWHTHEHAWAQNEDVLKKKTKKKNTTKQAEGEKKKIHAHHPNTHNGRRRGLTKTPQVK